MRLQHKQQQRIKEFTALASTHGAKMGMWSSTITAPTPAAGFKYKARETLLKEVSALLEKMFEKTEMLIPANYNGSDIIQLSTNDVNALFARSIIFLRKNSTPTSEQKTQMNIWLHQYVSTPFPSELQKTSEKGLSALKIIARNKIFAYFVLYALQLETEHAADSLSNFGSEASQLGLEYQISGAKMLDVLLMINNKKLAPVSISAISDIWLNMAQYGYDFTDLLEVVKNENSLYEYLTTPNCILQFAQKSFNKRESFAEEDILQRIEYTKILTLALSSNFDLHQEVKNSIAKIVLANLGSKHPSLIEQIKFMQYIYGTTQTRIIFNTAKLEEYCGKSSVKNKELLAFTMELGGKLPVGSLDDRLELIEIFLNLLKNCDITAKNKTSLVNYIFTVINKELALFSALNILSLKIADEDLGKKAGNILQNHLAKHYFEQLRKSNGEMRIGNCCFLPLILQLCMPQDVQYPGCKKHRV
jgi:hypothetical protein